jgi:Phage protein Gp138 N-terminal domain
MDAVQGQQADTTAGNEFNAMSFVAQQILNLISTSKVVQVLACTNSGGVSPVGYVDVQPLVNQLDGSGRAVPHAPIYGVPYARLQGGANAIIIDPQPGDIGVAVFADRDISSVKANKGPANPGSFRKFDMADGIYLGMILNGAPTQYVQFNADGITMHSPIKITLDAPEVDITTTTLNMQATGTATLNSPANTISGGNTSVDGRNFLGHVHDQTAPAPPGTHSGPVF